MAGENTKIVRPQGGDVLQVKTGGKIVPDSGTQAAAIAAVATADADATYGQPEADLINELKTKVNALLTACRNVGVMAP